MQGPADFFFRTSRILDGSSSPRKKDEVEFYTEWNFTKNMLEAVDVC